MKAPSLILVILLSGGCATCDFLGGPPSLNPCLDRCIEILAEPDCDYDGMVWYHTHRPRRHFHAALYRNNPDGTTSHFSAFGGNEIFISGRALRWATYHPRVGRIAKEKGGG